MSELEIVEQRNVVFYGDVLSAARGDDGRIYANFTQVCDVLGINTRAQRRRLAEHDVLGPALTTGIMPTDGGPQRVYVIRVDMVPLWLSTLRVRSVREELREKLRQYQLEAAAVLWEAFRDGRLTAEPGDALAAVSPETLQAVQMAEAVLMLARNQAAIEQRLSGQIEALGARLETVEAAMGDKARLITEDQATALSQAVKAVALTLGKRSGRNEFGQVWANLYRRYGVAAYRQLPARRFNEAMRWLDQWYQEALGDGS